MHMQRYAGETLTCSFNSPRSCLASGSCGIRQAAALLCQLAGTVSCSVNQAARSIPSTPCRRIVCTSQRCPTSMHLSEVMG